MELDTIKQYSHKIKKIYIKNDNSISQYNNVIIKININDKKDNETIRFSMGEYNTWLTHQSFDNDYFLEIPNKMKTTITIYAHYFPTSLYDYLEDQQVFSIYNWNNISNAQIDSARYHYTLDNDDNLIVRSLLNNSIDGFKNPNYKNYTHLNIDGSSKSNMTEKGYFPLSSRYRSYKYLNAPLINNNIQEWTSSPMSNKDCSRYYDEPYWEARIHKSMLSPLIGNLQDGEYLPINVHLNYQYLPSSTEYHQHFFGFEPENIQSNSIFTILDGENLKTINTDFDDDNTNSTYRIINKGNPFDHQHTLTTQHEKEILINLENGVVKKDKNNDTCKWERDICDSYWIYTSQGEGNVSINLDINEDEIYKIEYFIYIPSTSIVENDSCYIYIEHRDDFGNLSITNFGDTIQNTLLQQDKKLRDQWIYHEINFTAQNFNKIIIKGPQNNDSKIFFTNIKLTQITEYTPTLKYTGNGLYITEQDKYTRKSISEQSDECINTDFNHVKEWIPKNKLPTPITDVFINLEDEPSVLYNPSTSDLLFWKSNNSSFDLIYDNNTGLLSCINDDDMQLLYDEESSELKISQNTKKNFTFKNSSFNLKIQDIHNTPVLSGEVECSIVNEIDNDITCDNSVMCLGLAYPNINGIVSFQNINFQNIQPNKKHYLRMNYKNECSNINITKFKELHFEQEHINMDVYIDHSHTNNVSYIENRQENQLDNINGAYNLCVTKWYNRIDEKKYTYQTNASNRTIKTVEELPIHIFIKLYNQLNEELIDGYCELSIDDRIVQSGLVNSNGIVDFYIDYEDMYDTSEYNNYNHIFNQNIKIEYFNKDGDFIDYLYFDIVYDVNEEYDSRPAVPIKIYSMSSNEYVPLTVPIYNINTNETFMLNIDTEDYQDFYIKVMRNNVTIMEENIEQVDEDNMILVFGEYNNQTVDEYTIYTSSIRPDGKYRKNQRKFFVNFSDNFLYDKLTLDSHRYTLTSGTGDFIFSNTGLKVKGAVASDTFWYSPDNFLPADSYTVEIDYMDWGDDQFASDFGIEGMFLGVQPSRRVLSIYVNNNNRWRVVKDISNIDFIKGKTFKLVVSGNYAKNIKIYYDNQFLYTVTNVAQTRKQFFKTYINRMTIFKNLKIY